jgi:purine nucleosidase
MKKKVILDVDTGIDDAIGIILAATAPEIELLGITTVSGNIDLESATRNTLRVLKLLGKEDVKVYKGAESPLMRSIRYAVEVHGSSGLADQLEDIDVSYNESIEAWDFIKQMALQYPNEITLIMTGPQTNLALTLQKYPEVEKQLKEVIVMGGTVKDKGNESPVAEFNIAIDPEAAEQVFDSSLKVTMIGLDVTKKALLKRAHFEGLKKDSPVAAFVMNVTKQYMDRFYIDNGIYGCAMHDPLAVTMAITPELVKTYPYYVAVETQSRFCDGQTICDFDNRWGKDPNVYVGLEVDSPAFIDFLIARINAAV